MVAVAAGATGLSELLMAPGDDEVPPLPEAPAPIPPGSTAGEDPPTDAVLVATTAPTPARRDASEAVPGAATSTDGSLPLTVVVAGVVAAVLPEAVSVADVVSTVTLAPLVTLDVADGVTAAVVSRSVPGAVAGEAMAPSSEPPSMRAEPELLIVVPSLVALLVTSIVAALDEVPVVAAGDETSFEASLEGLGVAAPDELDGDGLESPGWLDGAVLDED
ncbi:MAG: hypothetical protein ACJ780_16005 [Solirubrobacteraceae bacterium]